MSIVLNYIYMYIYIDIRIKMCPRIWIDVHRGAQILVDIPEAFVLNCLSFIVRNDVGNPWSTDCQACQSGKAGHLMQLFIKRSLAKKRDLLQQDCQTCGFSFASILLPRKARRQVGLRRVLRSLRIEWQSKSEIERYWYCVYHTAYGSSKFFGVRQAPIKGPIGKNSGGRSRPKNALAALVLSPRQQSLMDP